MTEIILFVFALLAGASAVKFSLAVETVPSFVEVAATMWVVCAVLLVGCAIVGTINAKAKEILKRLPPLP